ncbi:MAG: NosD domain-containing protein [Candidatus Aminicenantales bacterium]
MKRKVASNWLWLVILFAAPLPSLANTYYKRLFERGVYMMEARANLKGAIPIFQEIVKRHPYDRHYAALSQFYLGLCYKRMGSDQALPAFVDVINNFPDQTAVVNIAKTWLSFLSQPKVQENQAPENPPPALAWSGRSIFGAKTLSPDGRFFTYFNRENGSMSLYDLIERKSVCFTHNGQGEGREEYAEMGVISPDSAQIAYSWRNQTGQSELWIKGLNGTPARRLLCGADRKRIFPLGWRGDSDRILVRMTDPDFTAQIFSISVSSGIMELIKDLGSSWPDQTRPSPDGRYLAYSRLQDGQRPERRLFLLSIPDKREIPLVIQPSDLSLLGWSSDGKNIFFTSEAKGSIDAWALSIWEGRPRPPARLIHSDIGRFYPLGLTPEGTLFMEMEKRANSGRAGDAGLSDIYAWQDFFTQKSRTLTVPDDYPTIQAAVSAAGSGDTVYVRKGVYAENIILGKSLTLQGEDRRATVIDGSGRASTIQVTASHVHLNGLTIKNGLDGINLTSNRPVHHLTIQNCVVTENAGEGLIIRNSGGFHLIENCIFSYNGDYAVNAHQFSRSIIRNCEVFRNSAGLRVGWGWYIQVTGNHVYRNLSSGICPDSCYYSTVEKNLIYANRKIGIKMGYISSRNTIRENIIMGHEEGIRIGLEWGGYSENRFYHNDVIDNQTAVGEAEKGLAGFQHWDNSSPGGGNFWSDFAGRDKDHDEIGDAPHELVGGARDHYPLMTPQHGLSALLAVDPGWLHSRDRRRTITAYIKLPAQIPAEDIDTSTLRLNDTLAAEKTRIVFEDSDGDGISELRVEFSGKKAVRILPSDQVTEITITGKLKNGLPFTGRSSLVGNTR